MLFAAAPRARGRRAGRGRAAVRGAAMLAGARQGSVADGKAVAACH
jgi:hypothetical protein